jgi:TM2 domain-containing membrane protein YozV
VSHAPSITIKSNTRGVFNMSNGTSDVSGKKIAAGICGILLGSLGIHKFILGYNTEGLIMLLVTLFTCGFAGLVFGIIGLIEGIIYLTKTDSEFYNTYVLGKKGWF